VSRLVSNLRHPCSSWARVSIVLVLLGASCTRSQPGSPWPRTFGSANADKALGVAAYGTGVYAVGVTDGSLPGQSTHGVTDAFLERYSISDSLVWSRQIGSAAADTATDVAVDGHGIFVSGNTQGSLAGRQAGHGDAFLGAFTSAGRTLWLRQFGSPGRDEATAVALGSHGPVVVGFSSKPILGTSSAGLTEAAFIESYNWRGHLLWIRHFGAGLTSALDVSVSGSSIYVVGHTWGSFPHEQRAGETDVFVARFDATGREHWIRQYGSQGSDSAQGVSATDAGVYVAGYTRDGTFPAQVGSPYGGGFISLLRPDGRLVWTRQQQTVPFPHPTPGLGPAGTSEFRDVVAVPGGAIVVGLRGDASYTEPPGPGSTAFVGEYSASGRFVWSEDIGATGRSDAESSAVDGRMIVAGGYVYGTGQGLSRTLNAFVSVVPQQDPAGSA
jgi:hypothetical protein